MKNRTLCVLVIIVSIISLSSFISIKKLEKDAKVGSKSELKAKIIQLIPQGDKSVLVLDRGSKHGVTVGTEGIIPTMNNFKFKITENYSFRSKSVVDTVVSYSSTKNVVLFVKDK